MHNRLTLILAPLILTAATSASFAVELTTDKQKFSYAVGTQVGFNIKQQGLDLDQDAFLAAIKDTITGAKPQMSGPEMQQAVEKYQKAQDQIRLAQAEKAQQAGKAFLEENKKKEGVVTTASGLQYKVITTGTGPKPTAKDVVSVHYRGTLINGKEFDSSYKRGQPTEFPVNGVIKGWQEGIQLMPVGSKWELYVPAELGYGARGAGHDIGPNEVLIFEVELLEIKAAPKPQQ